MLLQIECISRPDRNSPHRHLRGIGGRNADGTRWWLAEEDAVRGIQDGRYQFYVERHGRQLSVLVARSLQGDEYLKADGDGARPELLLALPECP